MAVTLTGTGGLFTRLGLTIGELNRVCTAFGSALNTGVSGISAQYASNDQIAVDNLFANRDAYRGVHSTWLNYLRGVAQTTVIEQVNRDTTLPSKTLYNALAELIRQMVSSSDSLNRPTIGTTVTAASTNSGDTTVYASTTSNTGVPLDQVLPETLTVTCTADVNSGGTQYGEPLGVVGQPVRAFDSYQWPGGSGANTTLTVTDGAVTTKITDGSFQSWGGTGNNTPSNWTIATGTAGTHVFRGTSPVRPSQSYSMQWTSDGTVLTAIKQQVTLLPQRVYAFNIWAKISTADATGAIRYRLVDGTGTVVSDDASTNNSYSRDVNTQTGTSFTQHQVFFRTPRQLPAQIFLEIAFTTAPTSGRIVHFSLGSLVEATQVYAGGPYIAAFSKTDYTTNGDYWTIAVANNLGTTSFIPSLDRLFNMRQLGLAFPSASSETVSDSLIT